jgi:hypothetical protein
VRRPWPLLLLLGSLCSLGGACARRQAPSALAGSGGGAFRVAIFGDMPYPGTGSPELPRALAAYRAVLDTIAAERVAFVVHIGDFSGAICSDSLYAQRQREFAAMPHPLVYTFGDNEWTDCARDTSELPGGRDPLERLARLRALFTQGDSSLGRPAMRIERQSSDRGYEAFRENVRWSQGGVLFLTLHAMGSNNNRGRDPVPPAEFVERNAADLAWLRAAFDRAQRDGLRGVAIFMQANPFVVPSANPSAGAAAPPPSGFTDLVSELRRLSVTFGRPVALVHGDTHYFRVDQPFVDTTTGLVITNLTRAETYGNPNHHALLMTVDPAAPNVFRFEPLVVRANVRR